MKTPDGGNLGAFGVKGAEGTEDVLAKPFSVLRHKTSSDWPKSEKECIGSYEFQG